MVVGNWKMNTSPAEAGRLIDSLLPMLSRFPSVERVVCPPFVALPEVARRLERTDILVGAQNVFFEDSGAWTGEVSGPMLHGLCRYVLVGHSERRAHFGETDETARKRVQAAIRNELRPIVCVGETLDEREAGVAAEVVTRQVTRALEGLEAGSLDQVAFAYEPVWAIGTGRAASPAEAGEMAGGVIRKALADKFGADTCAQTRILYGGSLTASNASGFFSQADVDGGLVGGASLRPDEFAAIVAAAA